MDKKLVPELTEEEKKLLAETFKKLVEQVLVVADHLSREAIAVLEESEQWKNYCETTKR